MSDLALPALLPERAVGPPSAPTTEARPVKGVLIARRAALPRPVSSVSRWSWSSSRRSAAASAPTLRRWPIPTRWPPSADAAGGGDRRAGQSRVRRRRRLGDRQVRVPRQGLPDHADRSAVLGVAGDRRPDLRHPVRRPGLSRAVAQGARHPDHLRGARHRAGDDLRDLPVRGARIDPADAGAGHAGRGSRACRSARAACRPSGA